MFHIEESPLIKIISRFGQLSWSHGGGFVTEEKERHPERNYDSYPRHFSWRFKKPNQMIDQAIVEAVESYKGSVEWHIKYRVKALGGINWCILPKRVDEYAREGKKYAPEGLNERLASSEYYIAKYEPEWGKLANTDIPNLAKHIEAYVTGKCGEILEKL
ncbi:MAG: hypothetical protein IPP74_06915 [Alphaproteobacteria bacterium]|nr:hypothetical protein [Alphaproteobacteria bacterium]